MSAKKNGRQYGAAKKHLPAHLTRSRFMRERLPMPIRYFYERGIRLSGAAEWRAMLCPFHPDKTPSLRVHLIDGRWRCMACGARGDLLEFHRRLHGLTFEQACRSLGAWDETP